MEGDCCKFTCGAPTTFQGYGIEKNRKYACLQNEFSQICFPDCNICSMSLCIYVTGSAILGLMEVHGRN